MASDLDDLTKKLAGLKLADIAGHLEDELAVLKSEREFATAHRAKEFPELAGSEEQGVIHVGDVHHNTTYAPPPAQPAPVAPASSPVAAVAGKASKLAQAGLLAAGLATGGIGAAVIPAVAHWLNSDPPAVVAPVEPMPTPDPNEYMLWLPDGHPPATN